MYARFANRPLFRRIDALSAAYAIALASLIASFGAIRSAVADANSLGIVICQPTLLGQSGPGDRDAGRGNSGCIACTVLLAAVPPPPTVSVAVEQTPGRRLLARAIVGHVRDRRARAHQSRAPPIDV